MNIAKIIIQLQKLAANNTDTQTALVLTKAIEKLKLGAVSVVNSAAQLPSLPLEVDGQLYLNTATEEVYYNSGNSWIILPYSIVTRAFSWGQNSTYSGGQLGDNTTTNRSVPVAVVGGISDWDEVSAGKDHMLAIANGIAYAWGRNLNGVIGDGTIVHRSSPVTVLGNITNWSQVSAGREHSLGIAEGIAYGWGTGSSGRLGDETTANKSSPVTVAGGITNWSQVSAGGQVSLGIANAIAYAWGTSFGGALGAGALFATSSPVTVVGGITNWSQVSVAQTELSLGIANGIAYAWGSNYSGELGDGTRTSRSSPVTVVGGITNWSQVSAGTTFGSGITDTGIAYAWGNNDSGRIGDGTVVNRSSPVTVIGGITNWSAISAGAGHILGLTDAGVLYAWGGNSTGQLGNNSTVSSVSPITVVRNPGWTQVSAGSSINVGLFTGPNSI
jgi:alpha-tubulin suppressor-like RCC1 family protein